MVNLDKWVVYVNGNYHSTVEAYDKEDALERVFDRGIGYYVHDMDAELYEDGQDPEEDYYPLRLYGN
jgi:hypothetical protein